MIDQVAVVSEHESTRNRTRHKIAAGLTAVLGLLLPIGLAGLGVALESTSVAAATRATSSGAVSPTAAQTVSLASESVDSDDTDSNHTDRDSGADNGQEELAPWYESPTLLALIAVIGTLAGTLGGAAFTGWLTHRIAEENRLHATEEADKARAEALRERLHQQRVRSIDALSASLSEFTVFALEKVAGRTGPLSEADASTWRLLRVNGGSVVQGSRIYMTEEHRKSALDDYKRNVKGHMGEQNPTYPSVERACVDFEKHQAICLELLRQDISNPE